MQPVIPPSRVAQLKAATSPATMLERLARDCEYSRRRGLRLVDCQAVRVYPRDGDRFVLEYEMRFLGADGERVERVFGEVVGEGVEDCYREVIESLRKTRRKQLSPDRATDLITCLPDLGLVLRFSGLDERLHGLKLIFKLPAVAPILSRYAAPGGKVTGVAAEVLSHRLGKRCTIRFRFQSPDPRTPGSQLPSRLSQSFTMFAPIRVGRWLWQCRNFGTAASAMEATSVSPSRLPTCRIGKCC